MEKVSIREFQQKAKNYLSTLPILLTRHGMPVAKVVAVDYEIKDVGEKKILENSVEDVHQAQLGRCRAPGCLEDAVGMGKVWEEGEEREVEMCKKHLFKSLKEAL